ncbi:hypothetical protein PSTT_10986 [Puccinia striiformis]|uniref:Uncharacterized protein n=1 Tax=Puccinia striiformis TaxID=27350 RepID=A0A2S4V232_9BASI|nr:hypothetical protein PSTT_10986 [Puccinia striiformis]
MRMRMKREKGKRKREWRARKGASGSNRNWKLDVKWTCHGEFQQYTVQLALFKPNPADEVKHGKKAEMLAKQAAHKLMLKESKSQKRKSANNKDSKPDEGASLRKSTRRTGTMCLPHAEYLRKIQTDQNRLRPIPPVFIFRSAKAPL